MKVRTGAFILFGILLVPLLAGATVWAGEVVVANKSVPAESLERATLADIYLGKKSRWDNGSAIRVAMLKGGSTHETFVREIVGTTPSQLKDFWKEVVFTGTGTPPKILGTEADLVEFVASTSGAIGYVDSSTAHGDVKTISIR